MRAILFLTAMFSLSCFGQDLNQNNQNRDLAQKDISSNTLAEKWSNYAANNSYIKGLFHQKREIDSQIDVLQNQRRESIAQDQHNTYRNNPYVVMDDTGSSKTYASKEAYDNEIIGGLIKQSLSTNNEIIKQKELYFASFASNAAVVPAPQLKPPMELKVSSK
jgi:hypothetical protein